MANRSEEKAKAALAKIEALNPKGSLSILLLDVTDEQSAKATAAHVQKQFGQLDVLVSNAAVSDLVIDSLKSHFHVYLETT